MKTISISLQEQARQLSCEAIAVMTGHRVRTAVILKDAFIEFCDTEIQGAENWLDAWEKFWSESGSVSAAELGTPTRAPSAYMIHAIADAAVDSMADFFYEPDPEFDEFSKEDLRSETVQKIVDAIRSAASVRVYVYHDEETAKKVATTISQRYGIRPVWHGPALEAPPDVMDKLLEETAAPHPLLILR